MKFGKHLAENAEPGWRYIQYDLLKNYLKESLKQRRNLEEGSVENNRGVVRDTSSINLDLSQLMVKEIQQADAFLQEKVKEMTKQVLEIERELAVLSDWADSNYPDVDKSIKGLVGRLTTTGAQIAKLLLFCELNVTAVRKISKKYNHIIGQHSGPLISQAEGSINHLEKLSEPKQLSDLAETIKECTIKAIELEQKFVAYKPGIRKRKVDTKAACSIRTTTQTSQEEKITFQAFLASQLLVTKRIYCQGGQSLLTNTSASSGTLKIVAFQVTAMIALSSMSAGNEAALTPLNDLYAEASRTELSTVAVAFALQYTVSWMFMVQVSEFIRSGSLWIPLLLSCAGAFAGNFVYNHAFTSLFSLVNFDGNTTFVGSLSPKHEQKNELVLFACFAMFGVGGWLFKIGPAIICMTPAVGKRVENLAALMAITPLIGAAFGRGIATVGWSWDYAQEEDATMSFLGVVRFNGFSFPTLLYSMLWFIVFPAVTFLQRSSWEVDDVTIRGFPEKSTRLKNPGARQVSWSFCFLIQALSSFTLRIVAILLSIVLTSVYLWTWPPLSIVGLFVTTMPILSLFFAWHGVLRFGLYASLRYSVILAVPLAIALLPLGHFAASDSWILLFSVSLLNFSLVSAAIGNQVASRLLEDFPDQVPFDDLGLLGPIVAVQTSRYAGEVAAFIFIALTYGSGFTDLTLTMQLAFAIIALANSMLCIMMVI